MKNLKNGSLIVVAACCIGNYVFAESSNLFVGMDIINNHMAIQKPSKAVFNKNLQAINAFFGYKMSERFFVETGYELSNNRKKNIIVYGGEDMLGVVTVPWVNYRTKMKTKMPYLGFGASYAILPETSISALVGVGMVKIKAVTEVKDAEFGGLAAYPADRVFRHYSKNKATAILRVAVTQKITDNFDVRVLGSWKQLNHFEVRAKEELVDKIIRLKNSYSFGLGLVYNL